MSQGRQMGAVPGADVVVTNPTHYAVAIKYDPNRCKAPIVVAKGIRLIAEKIKSLADEHNVIIVEHPPLARSLYKHIEIGDMVNHKHYQIVAEILAFVFHLRRKKKKKQNDTDLSGSSSYDII